jgi:hypothetical protein
MAYLTPNPNLFRKDKIVHTHARKYRGYTKFIGERKGCQKVFLTLHEGTEKVMYLANSRKGSPSANGTNKSIDLSFCLLPYLWP